MERKLQADLEHAERRVWPEHLVDVEILVAFVGACILLFLVRLIFRRGMVRT